jgi:hypothetical protein
MCMHCVFRGQTVIVNTVLSSVVSTIHATHTLAEMNSSPA